MGRRETSTNQVTFQLSKSRKSSFATKLLTKMDQIVQFVDPLKQFAKDSVRLVKRCTKPDKKEFQKIAVATAIGFAIMGFIGFFVKLIHIPINNIIVGSKYLIVTLEMMKDVHIICKMMKSHL